jgi:hypothetical protein
MFNFFEEFRNFQNLGGAGMVSAEARAIYYACLGVKNERQEEEDWVVATHDLLRFRSGVSEKTAYWRARKELEAAGFIRFDNVGRTSVRFQFLGVKYAIRHSTETGNRLQHETETETKPREAEGQNGDRLHSETEPETKPRRNRDETETNLRDNRDEPENNPPGDADQMDAPDPSNHTIPYHTSTGTPPAPRKRGGQRVSESERVSIPYSDAFTRFWTDYPRKESKSKAWLKWQELSENGWLPPIDVILAAIARQRASPQWRKDGGEFIPYPSTWLHQRRWEDGNASAAASGSNGYAERFRGKTDEQLRQSGFGKEHIAAIRRGILPGQPGFPPPD